MSCDRLDESGPCVERCCPVTLVTDLVYSPGLSSPAIRVVRRLRSGGLALGGTLSFFFLSLEAIPSLRSVLADCKETGSTTYYPGDWWVEPGPTCFNRERTAPLCGSHQSKRRVQ